jgi:phosphatidylinositol glycan class T
LFASKFKKICPFSKDTTLRIKPLPDYQLSVDASVTVNDRAEYKLNDTVNNVDFGVFYPDNNNVTFRTLYLIIENPKKVPITAHRYTGGTGQERGSLIVHFYNNGMYATNITYFESIPWILKTYLHTLKISVQEDGKPILQMPQKILYSPSIDRKRPTVLELAMELAGNSITTLSLEYECAFVKVIEHHPDANHGFEIGYFTINQYWNC